MVKGYKVFNPDWTCRPNGNFKQYTCPGKFEENISPIRCGQGMHFCRRAADCFNYYSFNPENHVAEVIAYGDIAEEGDKCCTNKLEIVREIPWAELLEIVNTGKGCTGLCNTGNRNTGNWNTGNWNTGDWNTGNRNTGNRNTGNWNTGDWNTGDWNTGNRNTGDWNTGNRNTGDWNTGDWNKCNFSNGCFNTVEPKIYLFNKPSEWTYRDWLNSDARYLLNQIPGDILRYVWFSEMTDEEKATHPEAETTGGYLKSLDNSKCGAIWWRDLSEENKSIIKAIPNFDKNIFKEITGIDVDANSASEV